MRRLNAVAAGDREADLVLRRCTVVSTYTGEAVEGLEIAVSGGRIAYVGPDASHAAGPGTAVHDAGGRYVVPGYADPHTHTDQFALPAELAARLVLRGTTCLFADPIDIACVGGGARGLEEIVRLSAGLPVRFFHAAPGGLPVDPRFSSARQMEPPALRAALGMREVACMGEVFAWTRVTSREPRTMAALSAAHSAGLPVNGHTAGLRGAKLCAYAASGILSCHEPVDYGQALERLRLGMWVMVREGSVRRDLRAIMRGVASSGIRTDRLMFCSDGVSPRDLERLGHMDHCLREAVSAGIPPADALAMASRNCFDYYGMAGDLGGVAPGRMADLLVLPDLESFVPDDVFVGGEPAVRGGRLTARCAAQLRRASSRRPRPWTRRTVRLGLLSPGDFAVRAPRGAAADGGSARAATIDLATEIITRRGSADLPVRGGAVHAAPDEGVWKVAALDRLSGSGRRAAGFLRNFGARGGALASTWSFHENDLVVMGSDDGAMAAAANLVVRSQGGMAFSPPGGRGPAAHVPLRLAGIASTDPIDDVAAAFASLDGALADAGCALGRPHLVPLFLTFLALPALRIVSSGLIDVKAGKRIPPVAP